MTLGTTNLAFVIRGTSTPTTGAAIACPSITAGATGTVSHSLASTNVIVQVKRVAAPYDVVDVQTGTPSTSTVSISPDTAINAGDFVVLIQKVG